MLARPSRSGNENSIFLSIRPGRMRAGSRVLGLLVANCEGQHSCSGEGGVGWYEVVCPRLLEVTYQDLNVSSRVETIELCDKLQHSSLNLIVTTSSVVKSSAANGIDFVEEYDTSLFGASQREESASLIRCGRQGKESWPLTLEPFSRLHQHISEPVPNQ